MKLAAWAAREGATARDISRWFRPQLSTAAVARWLAGKTVPREERLEVIARETDGEVSRGDFS